MIPTRAQSGNASDRWPQFDTIIVGAGTAGCIVAERLSRDPERRVLLLEAGEDLLPGAEPASVLDTFPRAAGEQRFLWPQLVAYATRGARAPRPYEQARVVGGGSTIMGMMALRGAPEDYSEWEQLGATGWSWSDVLPYFRQVEHDLDFTGPLHGSAGPIPVRRHREEEWPLFCRTIADVLRRQGYASIADLNGPFEDGVGAVPMSSSPEQRISSSIGYLGPQVRARRNLQIRTSASVRSLEWDGARVRGVRIERGGGAELLSGRDVILCAGAIQTPVLLLRSGVGSGSWLQSRGMPVVADLPGVGCNLQNHPLLALSAHLKPEARQAAHIRPGFQNCLRYSSGLANCAPGDMFLAFLGRTAWHALGRSIAGVIVSVYKSYSRGRVLLSDSPEHPESPEVRFDLLSDKRDLHRMVEGVQRARALLDSAEVASLRNEVFIPGVSALPRRLNRPGWSSAFASRAAVLAMDGSAVLRRRLVAVAGVDFGAWLEDRDRLAQFLLERVVPAGHPVGTCRMGSHDDPQAVVDSRCRVRGVGHLRVVDGSVMPTIIRANTNIPITMLAAKAADLIAHDGLAPD
jgi:5-(hydroxymethyl)furfural/furfural oxidase